MNDDDRAAIEDLFSRLQAVETRGASRDPEAEALIAERLAAHPGAAYYMAQTLIMQQRALAAAQGRIAELEASRQPQESGIFDSLFGPDLRPAANRAAPPPVPETQNRGGGFLAGAAQTALGVAGGMMIASAIAGAAQAEPDPAPSVEPGAAPEATDAGGADPSAGGGDGDGLFDGFLGDMFDL